MTGAALRVRTLVRKEIRQMFRDPRMRPIVFVSPVVQILLFGYAVNTDIVNTPLAVVDHDRSTASTQLIDAFLSSGYFTIKPTGDDPDDLVRAIDRGRVAVGVVIPPTFSRDLARGGAQIQIIVDGTNSNTGTVAQGYAVRIVRAVAQERSPHHATAAVALDLRAWYNPSLQSRAYNVPAVIGILLLLMCLLLTALAVVREREVGTLDQLAVTPVRPIELMLGKTIPVAAVGLLDLALITVVAVGWFAIPLRGSLLHLAPAAFLFIMAGLGVGLLISTVSRTQQEAFMTMFLFMLPAVILSGFFYPISSMPASVRWLTLLNPVRHFLEIVRSIFLKGTGPAELWPQYVALGAMAVTVLGMATWRFQRTPG